MNNKFTIRINLIYDYKSINLSIYNLRLKFYTLQSVDLEIQMIFRKMYN